MYLFSNKLAQLCAQKQREFLKIQRKKEEDRQKVISEQIQQFREKIRPFSLKIHYDSIIPKHIYTCWHTRDLPPLMYSNVKTLKQENPEFQVHIYDEERCRNFIKKYFDKDVLDAYNRLKPCSYKSDLWRFCILYIRGGIYVDIKYRCVHGFRLIALTEKEYFVRDRDSFGGTYTALIVTLPQNTILGKCIRQIVENVKNEYYGNNALDPTGPGLLGSYFSHEEKRAMELYFDHTHIPNYYENLYYIMFRDTIIMTYYKKYREEQKQFQRFEPYGVLWERRDIYYTNDSVDSNN